MACFYRMEVLLQILEEGHKRLHKLHRAPSLSTHTLALGRQARSPEASMLGQLSAENTEKLLLVPPQAVSVFPAIRPDVRGKELQKVPAPSL